jgi:hypothetical protein
LFSVTVLIGAGLVFLLQPIVARLILPLLGGSPAVWITSSAYFQTLLFFGYAYAHFATAWLGVRRQALFHLAVLALPWLLLPIALPLAFSQPNVGHPLSWLLLILTVVAALPFFVVSTSAPLLQRWFASTGHPAARDPYFLYAASNTGSLLALLSYPFLVEPLLGLADRGRLWALGYGLLAVLTAACALVVARSGTAKEPLPEPETEGPGLGWRIRFRWLLLAFVPSSLLLSVTLYLTTDIASVPLLWVVPLALYLLTFIIAFARRGLRSSGLSVLARTMPLVVLAVVVILLAEATEPAVLVLGLHLLCFVWISLVCHGLLARERPDARHLTEYYLWLSAGGVLGGLFNALLAPVLFQSVAEYPLILVVACMLRPAAKVAVQRFRSMDLWVPAAIGLLTQALVFGWHTAGLASGTRGVALAFGLPLICCYATLDRPVRFGLAVGAVLVASIWYPGVHGTAQVRVRSFFGLHRVTLDPTGSYRLLIHGNTVHGMQSVDPSRRDEPLAYYHRKGPAGKLFETLKGDERLANVGVIGLGAGSLSCYAKAGTHITFFEIDPAVIDLACHSGLFTFYSDCPAEKEVVPGDARLTLGQREERFGILVVDAFSSDAIPMHLLTREALALYRRQLTESGILLFNISNRYLALEPVLAALAADAGLLCMGRPDVHFNEEDQRQGKTPSHWVVLGSPEALQKLPSAMWWEVRPTPGTPLWTDDYCNLLGAFKWVGDQGP